MPIANGEAIHRLAWARNFFDDSGLINGLIDFCSCHLCSHRNWSCLVISIGRRRCDWASPHLGAALLILRSPAASRSSGPSMSPVPCWLLWLPTAPSPHATVLLHSLHRPLLLAFCPAAPSQEKLFPCWLLLSSNL
jgi:hypothetical protein